MVYDIAVNMITPSPTKKNIHSAIVTINGEYVNIAEFYWDADVRETTRNQAAIDVAVRKYQDRHRSIE